MLLSLMKLLLLRHWVAERAWLGFDHINPHGSGISMGHPIGCTGARIAVTIIYDMMHRNLRRGLETMCIGGGQGMAAVWERP